MLTGMPRTARASVGGLCYHVLNRGNARSDVFHKDGDFAAFVKLMASANARLPMRVLAYCLLNNHFHLVLWPHQDGNLSRWMQWLLTSHVRRYHRHYGSSGHVWQGRFKAFPVQQDQHLLAVLRYVERNPLRPSWWPAPRTGPGPAWRGVPRGFAPTCWRSGPLLAPRDWLARVQRALSKREEEALRRAIDRGQPFGAEDWVDRVAKQLGLESSLRPRGRPRKTEK